LKPATGTDVPVVAMKYMKVYRAKEYTGVRFIDASTERDEQIKLKQSVTTLTTPEEPYESRGSRTVLRGAGVKSPLLTRLAAVKVPCVI